MVPIMKKRISFTVLVLSALLLIAAAPLSAAPDISVILDGQTLSFDVPPQLVNGRMLVPLRAIFEAMGASIDWDGDTQTVTATKDGSVVVLTIGSASPMIDDKIVAIDQPGIIVDGRTLAPLRFVAEAFGGTVIWDGSTQTALITKPVDKPATLTDSSEEAYENEITAVGIVFPLEYIGKYTIIQHSIDSFSVYHTATYELMKEKDPKREYGTLFWIYRMELASTSEEDIGIMNELAIPLFKTDEFAYYMRMPTGADYDESDPEPWQTTEYKDLSYNNHELIVRIAESAYPLSS
jgi:hypothetical protein